MDYNEQMAQSKIKLIIGNETKMIKEKEHSVEGSAEKSAEGTTTNQVESNRSLKNAN